MASAERCCGHELRLPERGTTRYRSDWTGGNEQQPRRPGGRGGIRRGWQVGTALGDSRANDRRSLFRRVTLDGDAPSLGNLCGSASRGDRRRAAWSRRSGGAVWAPLPPELPMMDSSTTTAATTRSMVHVTPTAVGAPSDPACGTGAQSVGCGDRYALSRRWRMRAPGRWRSRAGPARLWRVARSRRRDPCGGGSGARAAAARRRSPHRNWRTARARR